MRNFTIVEERRGAPRVPVGEQIAATVGGIPVRITELSPIGARLEHEDRLPLTAPQLQLTHAGQTVTLPLHIVRTEIAGRNGGKLTYRTGIRFTGDRSVTEGLVSAILHRESAPSSKAPVVDEPSSPAPPPPEPEPPPAVPPPAPEVTAAAPVPFLTREQLSFDDSWTRQVKFLNVDPEDTLPYAQFRRSGDRWTKTYVATPEQPEDGFTTLRDEKDLPELQRTFEYADPETQHMMRIALKAKLEALTRT